MSESTLKVRVNGESREFDNGTSVSDVLRELGLRSEGVAVEVNRTIIPKSSYATNRLADGDDVEIVTFVGGG